MVQAAKIKGLFTQNAPAAPSGPPPLPAAVPISFSSSSGAPGYARGTAAGLSQSSHTTLPAHIAVLKSLVRIAAGVLGIVVVGGGLLVGIVYVSINRNPDSSDEQEQRSDAASGARSKQSDAALPGLRTQSEFTATDKWYFENNWQTFAPEDLVSYDFVQEKVDFAPDGRGLLQHFEDIPQPVKEAVSVGNNVWHVKRFHRGGAIPDTDLYLIRRTKDDGRVVEVDHQQNEKHGSLNWWQLWLLKKKYKSTWRGQVAGIMMATEIDHEWDMGDGELMRVEHGRCTSQSGTSLYFEGWLVRLNDAGDCVSMKDVWCNYVQRTEEHLGKKVISPCKHELGPLKRLK